MNREEARVPINAVTVQVEYRYGLVRLRDLSGVTLTMRCGVPRLTVHAMASTLEEKPRGGNWNRYLVAESLFWVPRWPRHVLRVFSLSNTES